MLRPALGDRNASKPRSGEGHRSFGSLGTRVLWFCWFGWALDLYDLLLLSFLRTEVQADLGLNAEQFGTVLAVQLGASALGGFLLGRLADRRGRVLGLSLSIVLFSVGTLLTGLVDGFLGLFLARALTGFGVGGEWGIGHALVSESVPEGSRGRAAGILQSAAPVGVAMAGLMASVLGESVGWRGCFMLSAIPGLSVFLLRFVLSGSVKSGRQEQAERRQVVPLSAFLNPPLLRPGVLLLVVLTLHMATFWSVYTWLPGELRKLHSAGSVAMLQLWISGVHLVADLVFGWLADRFGRRMVFFAFTVSFAAGLSVVALRFDELVTDLFAFGLVFVPLGLGMGTWSVFGVMFREHFPSGLRATASSGLYNLARGVQGVAQPAIGVSIAATGSLTTALWFGASATLGSALFAGLLPHQSSVDESTSRPESV